MFFVGIGSEKEDIQVVEKNKQTNQPSKSNYS